MPRIVFRVSHEGDGFRLTQEIHIRVGPLGAWLNKKRFNEVLQHMIEEGEELKILLEQGRQEPFNDLLKF